MTHLPQTNQSPSSVLRDLIPVAQRKRVYSAFGLVGFVLGAIAAAYAAVTQDMPPTGLVVATVVFNFISPLFSSLASANAVPTGKEALGE